jgi:hypothetical protein
MRALLTALLALAAATNAAAQERRSIDVAYVLVEALPAEIDAQPKSAVVGDVLFSQQVRIAETVRLDATVPISLASTREQVQSQLSAGSSLYRVVLDSDNSVRAYCSFETVSFERDSPRLPTYIRFCLADRDNDNAFDQMLWMQILLGGRREAGVWVRNSPLPFNGDVVSDGGALPSPAPYTALATHDIPPMTLQMIADLAVFGTSLRIKAFHDGVQNHINARGVDVPTTALPQIVELLGARVEVLAQEENGFRYRVVNGFPEGEQLRLGMPPVPAIIRR